MKKIILVVLMLLLCLQSSALAEERYYTGEKIKGYEQGDFLVVTGDDINFRTAPKTGSVLKVLSHHSLLRVLGQENDWLKADADGVEGYIYAPFVARGHKESLTEEDFVLGYAILGGKFDEKAAEAYLGKLVKTSYDKKSKRLQYVYPSVVIGVDKRKRTVQSIIITDQSFVTMRAVSVGDSAGRAVGQYGIPDGVAYLKEGVLYEYNWQDAKKQKLRFAMLIDTQSKVKIILLETRKK